jgi:hypothetical protein
MCSSELRRLNSKRIVNLSTTTTRAISAQARWGRVLARKGVERVLHILRQHRISIENRAFEFKRNCTLSRSVPTTCLGQQPSGERFVFAGCRERVENQPVLREHKTVAAVTHTGSDLTAQREGIELVEASAG